MTKAELEQILKHTFAWDLIGESGSVKEGQEELLNCMVEAYNKGVGDAIKVAKDSHTALEIEMKLYKLKI